MIDLTADKSARVFAAAKQDEGQLNPDELLDEERAQRPRRHRSETRRIHIHVPVFLDDLRAFGTTRFAVDQALDLHKQSPLSDHLEIETYTWDVLPEHLKNRTIDDFVIRELNYIKERLT